MARDLTGTANVELVIRDSLPAYLEELHKRREKLVTELLRINERIALCETLSRIAPAPEADLGASG